MDTATRGAKRLADEYMKAAKAAIELKKPIKPNVGALEKGTTAEFSGRIEAQFVSKQQLEFSRRIAAEQAKATQLLKDILGKLGVPPVKFQRGAFP